MSKRIQAVIELKDKMSQGMKNISKATDSSAKDIQKAEKKFSNFGTKSAKKISDVTDKILKLGAAAGGMALGAAIKGGLSEAMDLEGYKTQLVTATKDTKKASDIMTYAVNLANKTPFEGGQLVEGASKFEAMGMSAKKWLTYAGDMAGATNKDFDQSVEALIDAQQGELERLKEFGISKKMITKKANEMFKNEQVVNNKGQIEDQEKFNEALLAIMRDKYTGGMEKQSKTLKGVWSTVTGITKSSLASIVGMQADGTIKQGSLFDFLKKKIQTVANTLQKWQSDGTLDKIAKKATQGFKKIIASVEKTIAFIRKHKAVLTRLAKLTVIIFGIAAATSKVYLAGKRISKMIKGIRSALKVLNILGVSNPVVIGIMAIIAALTLIYLNWDKVKKVIEAVKQKVSAMVKNVVGKFNYLREQISSKCKAIRDRVVAMKDKVVGAFKALGNGIKSAVQSKLQWIIDKINAVVRTAKKVKNALSGPDPLTEKGAKIPKNANGSTRFAGGWTSINEHGPEMVKLPSGSQIIPHGHTKNALGKGGHNVTVNVTIQGNVIGNKQYAKELGEEVAGELIAALGNV